MLAAAWFWYDSLAARERATGYSWQGEYGVSAVSSYFEQLRQQGREAFLAKRNQKTKSSEGQRRSLESGAVKVISAMDSQGRWMNRGRIETRVFIRNLNTLCDFLESFGQSNDPRASQ